MARMPWLLLVLAADPAWAQEVTLEARGDLLLLRTTGTAEFSEKPRISDRLDLEDDLGLNGMDPAWAVAVGVRSGPDRLEICYERRATTWRTAFLEPVEFDGVVYPAGVTARCRLDLRATRLTYERAIAGDGDWAFHAGLRAAYWLTELEIVAAGPGQVDDHLGTAVVEPEVRMVAIVARPFSVEAAVAGTWYKVVDHTVRTLDGSASVVWSPAPKVALSLGYRATNLHFINVDRRQRNEFSLWSRGPFLSLELAY
jgi:hypothetical protein